MLSTYMLTHHMLIPASPSHQQQWYWMNLNLGKKLKHNWRSRVPSIIHENIVSETRDTTPNASTRHHQRYFHSWYHGIDNLLSWDIPPQSDLKCLKTSRAPSQYKDRLSQVWITILKIKWSRDRLIFNTGILILVRRHLYIDVLSWLQREC